MHIRIGASLLALGLAACGAESPADRAAERVVVRDSAGVQIVENSRPAHPDGLQYRVGSGPTLTIGSVDDPDQIIGAPQDALRLSDGRILVLDRMTQEILVFGPGGDRVDTWGGRGEGPGEFGLAMELVRLPGDSVAVRDLIMRRTTILGPDGETVRAFRNEFDPSAPGETTAGGESCCILVGALSGDSFVWRYPESYASDGPERRDVHATFVLVTPEGADTIGTFRSGTVGAWPDGTNPIVRERFTSRIGAGMAVGGSLIVGSGRAYDFHVVGVKTGLVERKVQALKARQPVTPELLQQQDEWEASRRDQVTRERLEQLARRPVGDSIAAFSSLNVTPSGEVWLREYELPPIDRSAYQVFSAEGEWLGRLELPGGGVVFDLDDSTLLRWVNGELDEPLIEVWSIGPAE